MKVLVILRTYRDVFQEKSIAVEAHRTDTLHGILRNAIQKAGWNENELRTRSIRVYDEDFEDYVDVGEDERPVDFGRYEVLLQSKTGIEVAAASQTRPTAATNIARFSAGARQTGDMPVEFYVKSIAGRTLTFKLLTKEDDNLYVLTTDTVETLKEKIERVTGIPASQQRLISSQGRQMRNERSWANFRCLPGQRWNKTPYE